MSFFNRKVADLEAKGIDPARVPPGQYVTERFPVLQSGEADVLIRNTTWTISRDTSLGFDFAPVTF